VADDLTRELGDPAEGLLAAALQFRANGSCPTPSSGATPGDQDRASGDSGLSLRPPAPGVMENNYDMALPAGFRGAQ
jgi:hypothetical protein